MTRLRENLLGSLLPALLLCAAPVASARAAEGDTLTLAVGVAYQHDDNLFRLADDADTGVLLGRSTRADDITTTTVGITVDKSYSLQRFVVDANLVETRHRNFDYLDFTARNYGAAWYWSVTPSLHGKLASERTESLNNFIDYSGYDTRNLRTDERHSFDAEYELSGGWRLLGGVAQTTRTNSKLFSQEDDNRLRTVETGVRYDFRSGTQLSLITRHGRGDYFNQDEPIVATLKDKRFEQRENTLRLNWLLSEKTTLDMRVAHLERTHANFDDRDFAGQLGSIGLNWQPTAKTALLTSLGRELSSYQSQTSSSIRTDRLTLVPTWQMTAKTTLRGRLSYARRHFLGSVVDSPLNGRFDTQRSALIAIDWRPLSALALSATLQNERRSSSQAGNDYDSTMAGVSAQYAF